MTNDKILNKTLGSFIKNIHQLFLESMMFIKTHKSFIFILIIAKLITNPIIEILVTYSFAPLFAQTIFKFTSDSLAYLIFNITLIKYIQRNGEFSFQIFKYDLKKLLLPIAVILILQILLITIGFILLIIPGIYLSMSYFLIMYFAICLNQPFSVASKNSSKLMNGYKFHFFIVTSIIYLPLVILSAALTIGDTSSAALIGGGLLVIQILATIITTICTIVVYFFWKQQLALAKKAAQEAFPE